MNQHPQFHQLLRQPIQCERKLIRHRACAHPQQGCRLCLRILLQHNSAQQRPVHQVVALRGEPKSITVDNGTEFASKAMDHWAYSNAVHLDFIRPGRPVENGYIESFNGRLRDE